MPYVSRRLLVSGKLPEKPIQDTEAPNLGRVVVVVAEPGGGKTAFAKALRDSCGAQYFTASGFALLDSTTLEMANEDLVIVDGLDEIAGKRWGEGVNRVLQRLREVKCPRVLITCRAAEWEGARNKSLIKDLFGEEPVQIQFAPFSFEELVSLVETFEPDISARHFLGEAKNRDLEEMLGNPESLRLLLSTVQGGTWPRTRTDLFELATQNLTRETNERLKTSDLIDRSRLIEAAGEIFASIMLSGQNGVDLVETIPGFQRLGDFGGEGSESRRAVLNTRLFRSDGETRLAPAHRMIAEYLGARWLGEKLRAQALSVRRLTAVIAPDGFVRTDLRGLHAWLATLALSEFRGAAIDRDPYGVLRYGDPAGFAISEKRKLLAALSELAEDDPYFRASEGGTSPAITGFFEAAMRGNFIAILNDVDRNHHLSTLLLAAIRGSDFAKLLAPELLEIASDDDRPYAERSDAAEALYHLPEIDWPSLVERLRKQGTESSARLCLEIIADRKAESIPPTSIADALADAMLMNSDARDADLSMRDIRVVEQLPASVLESVLDRLSERMAFMCDGPRRYSCNCLRALSPTVIRVLDRRLRDAPPYPKADQVWKWHRKTYLHQDLHREANVTSATMKSDDILRRAIQTLALRDTEFEDSPWMRYFRLWKSGVGLDLTTADVLYHMEQAVAGGLSVENVEIWTDLARLGGHEHEVRVLAERHVFACPVLVEKWQRIAAPRRVSYVELRLKASERKQKREAAKRKDERIKAFATARTQVEDGSSTEWLFHIAGAYLAHYSDIKGETPEARIADLLGEDAVEAALSGLRSALHRNDLPTLEKIVESTIEGKYWPIERVMCAGSLAHITIGRPIEEIPAQVLEAVRVSHYFEAAFREEEVARKALERVIFADERRVESFARRLFEPQFAAGRTQIDLLHLLTWDARFSSCAGRLAIRWLERFPDLEPSILRLLLHAAILFGDRAAVIDLISRKAADEPRSTDIERRSLWMGAAFLLDFKVHRSLVSAFAEEDRNRIWPFHAISAPDTGEKFGRWPRLGVEENRFILETFGPLWPKVELPRDGWIGDRHPWDAHDHLRRVARDIGSSNEPSAGEALDAFIENPALSDYHEELRHLRAGWHR